jgi:hypothetical protein
MRGGKKRQKIEKGAFSSSSSFFFGEWLGQCFEKLKIFSFGVSRVLQSSTFGDSSLANSLTWEQVFLL